MKKIILVTGGAGFIGSNLIERLIKNPSLEVISLDNYSTGTKDNHIHGVEYIEGDTADIASLLKRVPDVIYHLGEYSRTSASFEDTEKIVNYNIIGTAKLLEYVRINNIRLIYAGSSTKFSDGEEGKMQSPYALSKYNNSVLVKQYGEWFNIDYAITYFYNVYGPRERSGKYGTLIKIFEEKYQLNEMLPVVSPGTQKRNFTHVDDIVDGLILIGENGKGDNYALGNARTYSINEVAMLFTDNITKIPPRLGDRAGSTIDLSKMENEFSWKAKKDLSEYINNITNNDYGKNY